MRKEFHRKLLSNVIRRRYGQSSDFGTHREEMLIQCVGLDLQIKTQTIAILMVWDCWLFSELKTSKNFWLIRQHKFFSQSFAGLRVGRSAASLWGKRFQDAVKQAAAQHEELPSSEHDRGLRSESGISAAGSRARWCSNQGKWIYTRPHTDVGWSIWFVLQTLLVKLIGIDYVCMCKCLECMFTVWLHCALSLAAQCIVIGPVCLCLRVCNGRAVSEPY